MQQGALAAAGFPCQRDALARRDTQVHPAQHLDLLSGRAIGLGEIGNAQHVLMVGCHAKRTRCLTTASDISARTHRSVSADGTPPQIPTDEFVLKYQKPLRGIAY